jgi:hypothetical protein
MGNLEQPEYLIQQKRKVDADYEPESKRIRQRNESDEKIVEAVVSFYGNKALMRQRKILESPPVEISLEMSFEHFGHHVNQFG